LGCGRLATLNSKEYAKGRKKEELMLYVGVFAFTVVFVLACIGVVATAPHARKH
jgi:hypothetical protein